MEKNSIDLISVIVPIYNQENYLEKSINSILEQSYADIEIVAVNDGSTDSSQNMLERFASKDRRVRIINKENGGLIDAISEGVVNARGKYIAFVDPDDYVGRDYISELYDMADEEYEIVSAGMYSYEIQGKTSLKRKIYLDEDKTYKCKDIKNSFFWSKAGSHAVFPIFQSRCGKLYKKETVLAFIDEYRRHIGAEIGEDTIFNFLALCNTSSIKARKDPVEYYYCLRRDASMTRSVDFVSNYKKSKLTFVTFSETLRKHGETIDQAYELFYMQIQGLMYQASYSKNEYIKLQKIIRSDKDYRFAYNTLIGNAKGFARLNMLRKEINELYLPIWMAIIVRRLRSGLGIIRNRIGGIIH